MPNPNGELHPDLILYATQRAAEARILIDALAWALNLTPADKNEMEQKLLESIMIHYRMKHLVQPLFPFLTAADHVLHLRGFGTTPAAELPAETRRLASNGNFTPARLLSHVLAVDPLDPSHKLKSLMIPAQQAHIEHMNARQRASETLGLVYSPISRLAVSASHVPPEPQSLQVPSRLTPKIWMTRHKLNAPHVSKPSKLHSRELFYLVMNTIMIVN
ncbi:hypothetical protein R3P38DRAFT_3523129 [Favolaschia claudopus]|uniref:Uncharacterized protein n=1 Tax=Favolaschia claudopus TaxID=2862362 RepID=A0AAW0E9D2_9AGAR